MAATASQNKPRKDAEMLLKEQKQKKKTWNKDSFFSHKPRFFFPYPHNPLKKSGEDPIGLPCSFLTSKLRLKEGFSKDKTTAAFQQISSVLLALALLLAIPAALGQTSGSAPSDTAQSRFNPIPIKI